jgi:hypothetical protein
MRYSHWMPVKGRTYEMQNTISKFYPIALVFLLIGWGYREYCHSSTVNSYELAAKTAASDFAAVRDSNIKSINEAKQLRKTIDAMAGTIHKLGDTAQGINNEIRGAGSNNNEAIKLIRELRASLESQGRNALQGSIKP